MKKSILVLFSVLAIALFVGSGFSAWYFENTTFTPASDASVQGNVEISKVFELEGSIVVEDDLHNIIFSTKASDAPVLTGLDIVLDQGGKANKTDITKGIFFDYAGAKNTTRTLTITVTIKGSLTAGTIEATEAEKAEALDEVNNHNFDLTKSGNGVKINGNADNYIQLTGASGFGAVTTTPATEANDYTKTIVVTYTYGFQYKAGQKPQTRTDYNAMLSAIGEAATYTFFLDLVTEA